MFFLSVSSCPIVIPIRFSAPGSVECFYQMGKVMTSIPTITSRVIRAGVEACSY